MKIFIIGPGWVGKSTSWLILANQLDYIFIDLDTEFCNIIGNIGIYISENGYEKYCLENSKLFYNILNSDIENFVFVLSSGFLVHENLDELTLKHKQTLENSGISIMLLPSKSIDESVEIVVKRQLLRGFGLKEEKERVKFIHRFQIYKEFGDIKIFSHELPEIIAEKMKKELNKLF